jgi:molybdate transport system substrate-binding protein
MRVGCLTLVVISFLAGCHQRSSESRPQPLVMLAAASTREAVQECAKQFTRETGIEVKVSADDSSKLAEQIVNGAPADVFLSANVKWAEHVKEKGKVQTSVPLLGNALVIVVPKGNSAGIASPGDLSKARKIALAGPTVPAGMYARQALKQLKLLEALEAAGKIVPAENVRVALTFVERGECEAGIVYATDARVTDKVQVAYTFEAEAYEAIVYPLVLLKTANAGAARLYDYLQSPPAQAVFRQHGFVILKSHE